MDNTEQDKIWWERQKNDGWKNLTNPLAQDPAVNSRFNNFIKKFYWQFRHKKGIPRGSYNPEINFRGFKGFIISQKEAGKCLLNWNTEKIQQAIISIVINQTYLLNKLGMERYITRNPNTSFGKYGYQKIHFKKLIKTIAHELAHAHQYTINLNKEGEWSSCESSGEKDANGNFLYPELVAEHTKLTKEIKQMITASTKYHEFNYWWTNQQSFPETPEEDEEEVFEKLIFLLKGSEDLVSLEKNYQAVKKNSLYSEGKNTLGGNENNKKMLDNCYAKKVIECKLQKSNTNNVPKFGRGLWMFILILWGIALLAIVLFYCLRKEKEPKTKKT